MTASTESGRCGFLSLKPWVLTREQTQTVSGAGSNVQHGNPGGEPAPYNVHTSHGPGPAHYNLS
jgi:hypothetical protein